MGSCAAGGIFERRGEEMWASGWDWVSEERGETAAIQLPIVDTYLIYFLLKILMIINDFSQSPLALFTWEWVEGHCPSHIRAMAAACSREVVQPRWGIWCSLGAGAFVP